ncbi:MAG: VTC domain-containing protein [Propionibacteriaceae bacterium]|jgi:hypothetical protein|nr:VTC domain-containing protein [Propionibacteriaceae bacterium]
MIKTSQPESGALEPGLSGAVVREPAASKTGALEAGGLGTVAPETSLGSPVGASAPPPAAGGPAWSDRTDRLETGASAEPIAPAARGAAWSVRIGRLAAVDLAELTARAELMARRDRKYLLPESALGLVWDGLSADARVLEIDGRRRFDYHSVYYDTPELEAFFLTVGRRRRRYKLRTRQHGPQAPIMVEVKTRGPRGLTVKDRIGYYDRPWSADGAAEVAHGAASDKTAIPPVGAVPLVGADVRRLADEAASRPVVGPLGGRAGNPGALVGSPDGWSSGAAVEPLDGELVRAARAALAARGCRPPAAAWSPVLGCRYRRTTLLLPQGGRATIDTDLSWSGPDGAVRPAAGWAVVETKTLGPATSLDRALWAARVRPVSLSKFGVGLILTSPELPRHRWRRVIEDCFEAGRTWR